MLSNAVYFCHSDFRAHFLQKKEMRLLQSLYVSFKRGIICFQRARLVDIGKAVEGSSPLACATINTSFVYHDKRGIFIVLIYKSSSTGSGAVKKPLQSPTLCQKTAENAHFSGVLFIYLYGARIDKKGAGKRT